MRPAPDLASRPTAPPPAAPATEPGARLARLTADLGFAALVDWIELRARKMYPDKFRTEPISSEDA